MLKRIVTIAILTGGGQIFSLFVLKYISTRIASEQLKAIGQIDTLLFLMISIIASGLQPVAIRNLALATNWKYEYERTQQARVTLGFFLAVLGILALVNKYYLIFLLGPLLALSGDYALYAVGYPVYAAFIAFLRLAIPFLALLFFSYWQGFDISWVYAVSFGSVYAMSNFFIAKRLHTKYFFPPSFKSIQLYISSLSLGIVTLSLYFIGQGLILIAPYYYPSNVIASSFVGLKFYVIYKGILRIVHQAFIKEMINDKVSYFVDQLSIIAGIIFFGSITIFPDTLITVFFGNSYLSERNFFILLSFSAVIYSLFLSFATQSLLKKKDKEYTFVSVFAASVTILLLVIQSLFDQKVINIGLSVLIGEAIWVIGLIWINGTMHTILLRANFLFQNVLLLLIPALTKFLFGDKLMQYLLSFSVVGVLLLLLHRKKFETVNKFKSSTQI